MLRVEMPCIKKQFLKIGVDIDIEDTKYLSIHGDCEPKKLVPCTFENEGNVVIFSPKAFFYIDNLGVSKSQVAIILDSCAA